MYQTRISKMAAGSDIISGERKKQATIQPGDIIWCVTNLGEEYKGEVMGYDEQTKAVVIKSPATKQPQKFDVSIINLKLVDQSNFKLIEKSKGDPPPLPDLDRSKTEMRLRTAKERVGIGVSPEGQMLFDFIRKTITECHWNGQNIVIFDEIEIKPPYTLDNCSGRDNARSLDYIKSIMTKFYKDTPISQTQPATTGTAT